MLLRKKLLIQLINIINNIIRRHLLILRRIIIISRKLLSLLTLHLLPPIKIVPTRRDRVRLQLNRPISHSLLTNLAIHAHSAHIAHFIRVFALPYIDLLIVDVWDVALHSDDHLGVGALEGGVGLLVGLEELEVGGASPDLVLDELLDGYSWSGGLLNYIFAYENLLFRFWPF